MTTCEEQYKEYILIIDDKIKDNLNKIDSIIIKKNYLYKLISGLKEYIINGKEICNKITKLYTDTSLQIPKYFTRIDISKVTLYNEDKIKLSVLRNYLISFIQQVSREKVLQSEVSKLNLEKVPLEIYKYIIESFNTDMSKYILNGGTFNLGYGLGNLHIEKKERKKEQKPAINWGESNKVKKELLDAGERLYDHLSFPTGKKWLIRFSDDSSYWWRWGCKGRYIKNIQYFSFVPTNFINTKERSQNLIATTSKSISDILNNEKLGNRDKLNILLKFDPTHAIKYTHA